MPLSLGMEANETTLCKKHKITQSSGLTVSMYQIEQLNTVETYFGPEEEGWGCRGEGEGKGSQLLLGKMPNELKA